MKQDPEHENHIKYHVTSSIEPPSENSLLEDLCRSVLAGQLNGMDVVMPHLWVRTTEGTHVITFEPSLDNFCPHSVRAALIGTMRDARFGVPEAYCFVHGAVGYSVPEGMDPVKAHFMMKAAEEACDSGTFDLSFPGATERLFLSWGTPTEFGLRTMILKRDASNKILVNPDSTLDTINPDGFLVNLWEAPKCK